MNLSESTVIGENIFRHRKRIGLTQGKLATELGVTPQAVSKWENTRTCPDIMLLPLLASVFSVSIDELFAEGGGKS